MPNCFIGRFADAPGLLRVTRLIGPFDVVGQVRVGVVGAARRERDEQARLVDEVDAGLEVVAEAAHAGHVPREVVAELDTCAARSSAAC